MAYTDEQVIDAYFVGRSKIAAARILGVSKQLVGNRLTILHYAGVKVPKLDGNSRRYRYTPERVAELNDYIERKTQETNAGKL